jgi:hypothetical protein
MHRGLAHHSLIRPLVGFLSLCVRPSNLSRSGSQADADTPSSAWSTSAPADMWNPQLGILVAQMLHARKAPSPQSPPLASRSRRSIIPQTASGVRSTICNWRHVIPISVDLSRTVANAEIRAFADDLSNHGKAEEATNDQEGRLLDQ